MLELEREPGSHAVKNKARYCLVKRSSFTGFMMALALGRSALALDLPLSSGGFEPQRSATADEAGATPVAGATLSKVPPTIEPPMGTKAAEMTAKVRGGKPRSAKAAAAAARAAADVEPQASGRFWELQLNLCNSGYAACYAHGNAIIEGGDLIYYLRPNMVTLNEICLNDLSSYLLPSLGETWPGDWVYFAFMPAIDKRTNAAYKCKNGYDFGNAVMGRVPAASYQGVNAWGGQYIPQDGGNEQRTFSCAHAKGDHFGCATHLSRSEPKALAQCRALMFDAVPYIRSVEGVSGRTIVGGDFNLDYDTSDPENVQRCVPKGYTRKGDGSVQHVIFSNDLAFRGTATYGLTYTDHDGFLVRLTMP